FLLDLRRIDVDAAADDHIFGTACDVEESIFIASRQVASVEPSFGIEHLGGSGWIVPIAPANVWTSQAPLADLIGCDRIPLGIESPRLRKHHRLTNRTRLAQRVLVAHGKTVHADLGQPVALAKNQSALLVGMEKLQRKRSASAGTPAQMAAIERCEFWRIEEHFEDRRHAEKKRALVVPESS